MAITQPAVTEQRNGPSAKQNHVTNVTRVHADADGIIKLTEGHGALKSVDVADVDLVLGFADGSYIIIPNGALDALEADAPKVQFGDSFNTNLTELFKQVGTVDAADAGNLRIISENIDTRLTELQPDEIDYAALFMLSTTRTPRPPHQLRLCPKRHPCRNRPLPTRFNAAVSMAVAITAASLSMRLFRHAWISQRCSVWVTALKHLKV